jgi:hypothetical protein
MPAADEYALDARMRKSQKFALHLHAKGITPDDLAKMHPNMVAHHAMLANVRSPSEETLQMTSEHLDRLHNPRLTDQYQPVDPFEGLS